MVRESLAYAMENVNTRKEAHWQCLRNGIRNFIVDLNASNDIWKCIRFQPGAGFPFTYYRIAKESLEDDRQSK